MIKKTSALLLLTFLVFSTSLINGIFIVDNIAGNNEGKTGEAVVLDELLGVAADGPSIILNSPAENGTYKPGTAINVGITDGDGINISFYHYRTNNTPPSDWTSGGFRWDDPECASLPDGPVGRVFLHIFANDSLGDNNTAMFQFLRDGENPIITLNSPNNGTTHAPGTTIDLTVSDSGSLNHVLYNWDGGTNATLTSPYDLTLPTGNGEHVLRVYANDSAGNRESAVYVFTTEDVPIPGFPLLTIFVALAAGICVILRRRSEKAIS